MCCMWRLFDIHSIIPRNLVHPLSFSLTIQLMLLSNILNDSKDYINYSMMGKKYISVFCILWMIQNKLWHCTFAKAQCCLCCCLLLGVYIYSKLVRCHCWCISWIFPPFLRVHVQQQSAPPSLHKFKLTLLLHKSFVNYADLCIFKLKLVTPHKIVLTWRLVVTKYLHTVIARCNCFKANRANQQS